VNTAGQALFMCGYLDDKTGAYNSAGLFLWSEGVVRAIALPGQAAPLPGGPVYTSFSSPRLDDSGRGHLCGSGRRRGPEARSGLFRRDAVGAATLAVSGDPVPGWDGELYRAMLDPATNATGGVAFLALLDPPPAAGSSTALLISSGLSARTAFLDGDPVGDDGSLSLRVDDRLAARAARPPGRRLSARGCPAPRRHGSGRFVPGPAGLILSPRVQEQGRSERIAAELRAVQGHSASIAHGGGLRHRKPKAECPFFQRRGHCLGGNLAPDLVPVGAGILQADRRSLVMHDRTPRESAGSSGSACVWISRPPAETSNWDGCVIPSVCG